MGCSCVQPLYKCHEVSGGALGWDVGDCCGNGEVMLDWEARKVCVSLCVCEKKLRIKTGRETPRGKESFAWSPLDNNSLKKKQGRKGETQKKMTNRALGF